MAAAPHLKSLMALRARYGFWYIRRSSFTSSSGSSGTPKPRIKILLSSFAMIGTGVAAFISVLLENSRSKKLKCEENQSGKTVADVKMETTFLNDITNTKIRLHSPSALKSAIEDARIFVQQLREETGAPGLVVAVSVDGTLVWNEGFGYADVENNVKCTPRTVMRIASISKSLTATAVAKLYEENKLDLDSPIQKYVPTFPHKTCQGEQVTITTRQLLSHLGGIRHYKKPEKQKEEDGTKTKRLDRDEIEKEDEGNDDYDMTSSNKGVNTRAPIKKDREDEDEIKQNAKDKDGVKNKTTRGKDERINNTEFDKPEYYFKKPKSIMESLTLFQDDPLISKPGDSYLYTTHGWTLISAVVDAATEEDFLTYMKKLFRELGMENTAPEYHDRIIYNRARQYIRAKKHGLANAPYVDNSYKWAGGGFISTAHDLVRFGNAMLYARQIGLVDNQTDKTTRLPPGILKPETINEMWTAVKQTEGTAHKDGWYGWGWVILPEKQNFGCCRQQRKIVFHTGAAVGGVSVLLIQPDNQCTPDAPSIPPRGIVVALIMNLQEVSRSVEGAAKQVATIFDDKLNCTQKNTPDN